MGETNISRSAQSSPIRESCTGSVAGLWWSMVSSSSSSNAAAVTPVLTRFQFPRSTEGWRDGPNSLIFFFWCVRPLFLSLSSSYFLGFWCVHIFFFAVRLGWGGFQLDMDITSSNGSKLTLTPLLRGAYGASHGWTGDSIAFSAIYTG